jgi:hypothetical protein
VEDRGSTVGVFLGGCVGVASAPTPQGRGVARTLSCCWPLPSPCPPLLGIFGACVWVWVWVHACVRLQPDLLEALVDVVLGAPVARPRFKPAQSLLSYTIPNLTQRRFKMHHKMVHSNRRRDVRSVFRAWRRQAALQIDIRNKSRVMALVRGRSLKHTARTSMHSVLAGGVTLAGGVCRLCVVPAAVSPAARAVGNHGWRGYHVLLSPCPQFTRVFNRHTIMRRIFNRRFRNHNASLIQRLWRKRMFAIKVRAATMILPLLQKHLWAMRRARMRALRHDAARALQVWPGGAPGCGALMSCVALMCVWVRARSIGVCVCGGGGASALCL